VDILSAALALAIAALFFIPATRWPTAGRLLVALVFLGGAAFNLAYTLPRAPGSLEDLVATAPVPLYGDVVRAAVAWNAAAFTLLVVAFELAVGLLALWHGPLVRLALLGAAAWCIGMLPVVPPDGVLIGIALTGAPGAAALLLARHTYERTVFAPRTHRPQTGQSASSTPSARRTWPSAPGWRFTRRLPVSTGRATLR
jgi:hypothetical protein